MDKDTIPAPPTDSELARRTAGMFRTARSVNDDITPEQYLSAVGNNIIPDDVLDPDGALDIVHISIAASSGDDRLPVLIVSPKGASGRRPCVYYTANGGKIRQGETAGVTHAEMRWVAELGITFISISPRPGPVYRHPVQVEDAYVGLQWIVENAEDLGIDPDAIMLMGKSGGGGIAASTALYARDRGGPALAFQLLIYPMLDDRRVTTSSKFAASGWTGVHNRMGWRSILGDETGGPNVSPYAAAARATDLRNLPPAYVEVGSSEIFRDEDLHYAMGLAEAGVPVEIHSWMGGFHGFEIIAPEAEISQACLRARHSFVQRAVDAIRSRGAENISPG